jgi:hypothetical protein
VGINNEVCDGVDDDMDFGRDRCGANTTKASDSIVLHIVTTECIMIPASDIVLDIVVVVMILQFQY